LLLNADGHEESDLNHITDDALCRNMTHNDVKIVKDICRCATYNLEKYTFASYYSRSTTSVKIYRGGRCLL
jgi:hypothetical protein